jgi:hypothetical protein
MWIISTSLVDQVPSGVEQTRDYRDNYLLSRTFPVDFARWLQPSPTIQVGKIRLGTDKLAHFFSEGWWYYKRWKKNQDRFSSEESQLKLIEYGVQLEWWVHGMLLTGILSPADMEANYQGFVFYHQLCHGENPLLREQDGAWLFSESFDLGDYVSPEWDESWNPNIYGSLRWKGIRSTMQSYCPMLNSDWVRRQRKYYADQDTTTLVEVFLNERVKEGDLPDPKKFDIETICKDLPGQTGSGD